jgi:CheY-like chemotaxis protein
MPEQTLFGTSLLLVENNGVTREGLAAVLRREGCRVALAADGEEALTYLRQAPPPDLMLLDMLLPVVDGWGVLKELRSNPALAGVPAVVVTGLSIATPAWAASLGAAGLLRKPVETDALLAEVRRCRRRGSTGLERGKPSRS